MTETQQLPCSGLFQYSLPDLLDEFRSRMRIAVIFGGDRRHDDAVIYRSVNPRPWKSYEAVARDIHDALREAGFANVILLRDDMTLPQRLKDEGVHLAWLNSGGVQGYSSVSHCAAALEMLGIPYVGHPPHHACLLDNKDMFKRELQALGIRTAPFVTWHPASGPLATGAGSWFERVFHHYDGPFVLKPVSGRASLDVTVIDSAETLAAAADDLARRTRNTVLIETFLGGREFCVAVCGGTLHSGGALVHSGRPFAFATVERLLEPGESIFTSMDTRAITTDRVRAVTPDEPEHAALSGIARAIYAKFALSSLIRVDVRADEHGELHVLEANPKPDLARGNGAATSLVTAHLARANLTYSDLILSLLADRMDYLFRHAPESVLHLAELVV